MNSIKKRNGYIKEYYLNGNLKFEGEYVNGRRNGKGKEYNDKGKLIFEGEYLYDCKLKGKIFNKENLGYKGEFLYNKKWNGKGFCENANEIYELKNGKGKVKEYNLAEELKYEGEYLNGRRNGKGKEYNDDENLIFEGFYLNGLKHGKCKEYSKDGKIMIKGEYLNGRYWNIKTYDKNGNINGEIKRGKGIGFDYHMPDNIIFEGEYVNGLKNGKGKEYDDENNLLFEGEYLNNLRHEKEKSIIIMERYILKESIYMGEDGMLKNMMITKILLMK